MRPVSARLQLPLRLPYGLIATMYGTRRSLKLRGELDFKMLAVIAIRALESIFLIGMLGCVAVVILTTLEDIKVLLGKDDHAIK
jgi:hypothetical protein